MIGDDPLDAKILTAIANLNNHIMEGTSTKELNRSGIYVTLPIDRANSKNYRLKANHVSHFQSSDLYRRVMTLLESYRYRQHVRRYIIDLFDKSVVEQIVRDGRAEQDSIESPQTPEDVR